MKGIRTRLSGIGLALALLAPAAAQAQAQDRPQIFADIFNGIAFTEDDRVYVNPPFGPSFRFRTDFDTSVAVGGRVGAWVPGIPWLGGAFGVSYHAPDIEDGGGNIDIIPLSFLIMARIPVQESDEYPDGQVQPYAAVGPAMVISQFEGGVVDDTTVDAGVDVRGGLRFHLTPAVSLFGEYRYTYVEPEFEDSGFDIEPEIHTHHVNFGVGLHF